MEPMTMKILGEVEFKIVLGAGSTPINIKRIYICSSLLRKSVLKSSDKEIEPTRYGGRSLTIETSEQCQYTRKPMLRNPPSSSTLCHLYTKIMKTVHYAIGRWSCHQGDT